MVCFYISDILIVISLLEISVISIIDSDNRAWYNCELSSDISWVMTLVFLQQEFYVIKYQRALALSI